MSISEVRKGDSLKVIVINGFLSESNNDVTDWLDVVDINFPQATVLHFDWKASSLKSVLIKSAKIYTAQNIATYAAAVGTSMTLPALTPVVLAAGKVKYAGLTGGAKSEWKQSLINAELAGVELANYIGSHKGQYVLMGHSLGARVAFHCLKNLAPSKMVLSAFLFGGAIPINEKWNEITEKKPSLRIYNAHSKNDYVLKVLYRAGTKLSEHPIGLRPINQKNAKGILNIDMSKLVSGHMEYKNTEVGRYLNYFWRD
ncbi:DUF726 domain-containing protein [Vibrio harveyi]|uniref:DUF726 domain-containing protein n=1 Tax=Vibrio owensii TaxID=696485 RepID=UPI003CC538FD